MFHDAHYLINTCLLLALCSTGNTFHSLVCGVKLSVNSSLGRQLPGLVRSRTPGAQAGLAFRYTANRRVVPGRTPGSVTHSATEIGLDAGGPEASTTQRRAN